MTKKIVKATFEDEKGNKVIVTTVIENDSFDITCEFEPEIHVDTADEPYINAAINYIDLIKNQ